MDAEGITIRREIVISASPETVWDFLVDPAKAVRWMGVRASLEPRPGGRYQVEVLPGDVAAGVFIEVDPPSRLVHTWGWASGGRGDMPEGSTTVEYQLTAVESGTLLRLTHSRLPNETAAANHERGWRHYLERLAAGAAGDLKSADPWVEEGVPWRA